MKKRVISLMMILLLMFSSLSFRIYCIALKSENDVATKNTLRSNEISATRGNIYDTNFKKLTNVKENYIACIKPTADSFIKIKTLKNHEAIENELKKGHLVTTEVPFLSYFEQSNSILTLTTYERYNDNSLSHILGYCNESGGVYGIEKHFNKILDKTSGSLVLKYHCDALGRVLNGEKTEVFNNNYNNKAGIVLTIDKDIQKITENALINHNISTGCAVVLDVTTGEILACASTPVINRENLSETLNNPDLPFLNRAFSAYPVGSVFKVVTAAAMLENGNDEFIYNCEGSILKSENLFYCNNRQGHGEMNLKSALSVSCNPYFIELSTKVGAKSLLETAVSLGFNRRTDFGNDFMTDQGCLPDINELNSEAAIGNLGFGQGKLLATPLQVAACYATIANGGTYYEPSLIKGYINSDEKFSSAGKAKGISALKKSTCDILKEDLLETIKKGTGKPAFTSLFDSCGKTATAQSGQYNSDGTEIKHSWFAGFFPYDNPRYAICIMKENGASGSSDDAPVFKEISENIYILNRMR
ncbi:MAG: penicillin-binding protein 2 [Clostridia bacterium]|nr:penicillin-binding protein 2 [Clostridia bacterium]